jgi:hypothetical protein
VPCQITIPPFRTTKTAFPHPTCPCRYKLSRLERLSSSLGSATTSSDVLLDFAATRETHAATLALCGTLDCPACGIGFDGAQPTHTRYEVDAVLLMVDGDAKIATISSFRAETASRPALPPATPCLALPRRHAIECCFFLQFLYFLSGHAPWSDILHIIIYSIRSTRRLSLCMCLGRLHGPSERWEPRIERE